MNRIACFRKFFMAALVGGLNVGILQAQDCDSYYATKVGTMVEITAFDAKNAVMMKTQLTTLSNTEIEGGQKVVIASCRFDRKGECIDSGNMEYICQNGEFRIDLKTKPTGMASFLGTKEKGELHMESSDLVLPSKMAMGMKLPDAFFRMTTVYGRYAKMDVATEYTNRKVTDREKITTPAGTFECIVVEHDQSMVVVTPNIKEYRDGEDKYIEVDGRKTVTGTNHVVTWYAIGVGAVRSETYQDGIVTYHTEITKISGN